MSLTARVALIASLAALAAPAACKKRPAPDADATGPTLNAEPASPAASESDARAYSADPDGPRERQCYVALKRSWGTALRSVKAVGTRQDVMRQAQIKACTEIGVVEATCTDDLFNMELAGCVGDPRPSRGPMGSSSEAAAAIQEALRTQQGAVDLRGDDAGADAAPAPETPDAAPPSNVPELDGQPIPL